MFNEVPVCDAAEERFLEGLIPTTFGHAHKHEHTKIAKPVLQDHASSACILVGLGI